MKVSCTIKKMKVIKEELKKYLYYKKMKVIKEELKKYLIGDDNNKAIVYSNVYERKNRQLVRYPTIS